MLAVDVGRTSWAQPVAVVVEDQQVGVVDGRRGQPLGEVEGLRDREEGVGPSVLDGQRRDTSGREGDADGRVVGLELPESGGVDPREGFAGPLGAVPGREVGGGIGAPGEPGSSRW